MRAAVRFSLIATLLVLLVGLPTLEFRAQYAHHKRLREVAPGVLYRSGQLTAAGFRDAVNRAGIRTIANCQNELPGEDVYADPHVYLTFWSRATVRETAVCRDLGVKYVHLEPDLRSNRTDPTARPQVIDDFLALLDDPANHPVLLHCKAGLHRTGVLVAVYRMEYEGWDPLAAVTELKANGFGDSAATAANDYIQQYILNYKPRGQKTEDRGQKTAFCPLSSVLCPSTP
jgi:tyrosine-protein phosphatase SIW14